MISDENMRQLKAMIEAVLDERGFKKLPTAHALRQRRYEERQKASGKKTGKASGIAPAKRQKASGIEFDLLQGVFKGIGVDQELRWQSAFPAVPIPPAIEQAAAWLKANPANRKKNHERFLVNWFTRAQERAGRVQR